MLKPLYSIYDQKTREYLHPFMSINEDTSKRDFYQTMSDIPIMSKHPQDFSLYYLGHFGTESGTITPNPEVQFLINGLDCITHIQKQQAQPNETTKVGDDSPIQPSSES